MKRFFTFLMAVWALLSISQTVKAADVTVYFQKPDWWSTPVHAYVYDDNGNSQSKDWASAGACTLYYTSTGKELWSYTFPDQYTNVIFKDGTNQYPKNDGTKMKVVNNYVYTINGTTGTSLSEFVKNSAFTYTLTGGYGEGGDWSDESANFEFVGDGKYTYTFTAAQTGEFRFRVKTSYTTNKELCPNVNSTTKRKELTSTPDDVEYADLNDNSATSFKYNYWYCNVTAGKKYTFTLSEQYVQATDGNYYHSRKLSVVPEEAVVTKVIKLLNGSSELTGSDGKYTLDLSGETSTDATITLNIDGTTYGLETAQTISVAGNTNVNFVANATAVLTLAKGLIYSLTVTEDGKMTVVAKEKGVADGNYYLVGNFFEEDGDNINYDKKYFRFIDNGDGTLSFDIPTTLNVKAQVLASDGTCYGPTENGNISKDNPTAEVKTVKGNLVAGTDYFTFTDRELTGDGIYKVTITVDEIGVPTAWKVDFDKTQRMAYFMVDPKEDADAVAHPCYTIKKDNGTTDNKFFGNVYLEANQHCFVVGNIQVNNDDGKTGILKTTPKLYLQGNGGLDITINTDKDIAPGYEKWQYTNVFPNKEGFYFPKTQSLYLEYNPSQGQKTVSDVVAGIAGEVKPKDGETPITSIQIVGNGVVDSWELDKAQDMTYNKTLDCWEYPFRTEKAESADNKFRFLANGSWAMNWGEESTNPEDQARTPYKDATQKGHEASMTDPNNLGFTTKGTEENRDGEGTYGDMIFNRPAGQWTIRFYIRSVSIDGGNWMKKVYGYTITGSESNDVILTYCNGQFIRTYSNNKAMNPDNDNVKIYEVYRYDKPAEETEPGKVDNIYAKGTVHLRRLNYIPANVGVVLIGVVPADGEYTENQQLAFSLLERTEDSEIAPTDSCKLWRNADTYILHGDKWNNYLVPTVQAVNNLGNAYVDKSGNITYRYFGLSNYYRTKHHHSLGTADTQPDYLGFFRLTSNGKSGANRAYLSIPANAEVGNGVGATYGYLDFNGQLLENQYHEQYESESPAKFANMAMVFDDLIEGNETTGIKELETEVLNDNKYYNLQGVEVAYPVKGIYIHNGKKVIVK